MSIYAVIETGGKQYRVQQGDVLDVERLEGDQGKKIKLEQVLAFSNGKELKIGTPTLPGAKVTAEVVEHTRGDKIISFKMKRRKGYRRKKGHRQELTRIKILELGAGRKTTTKTEDPDKGEGDGS